MTEYIAVPERYIFKIKDKVSFSRACLVEPLAVAYRATQKLSNSKLREAKFILVIGAGAIGLLILQVLKIKGYKIDIAKDGGVIIGAHSIGVDIPVKNYLTYSEYVRKNGVFNEETPRGVAG